MDIKLSVFEIIICVLLVVLTLGLGIGFWKKLLYERSVYRTRYNRGHVTTLKSVKGKKRGKK